jgi:hypothetical protein
MNDATDPRARVQPMADFDVIVPALLATCSSWLR